MADFSTPILDEVNISSEDTIDGMNALVESSTPISDNIYIHEVDTSDSEHVLVESSIPVQLLVFTCHTYDRELD